MSEDGSGQNGGEGKRPVAVLVSADGKVVAQNDQATELLGDRVGATCEEALAVVPDADSLPCARGCAALAGEDAELHQVAVGDRNYTMCCVPGVDCHVTALIAAEEATESWERPTPREMEVLLLVAEGLTDIQIAGELGISQKTIRTHVEHMREKMGVRSRAALVARAFRKQLL